MPGLSVSVRPGRRRPASAVAEFRAFTARVEDAIGDGTRGADRIADREVLRILPRGGGFASYMAGRLTVHRSKIPGGLRLTVDAAGTDAARVNEGRLRHPLYGNRGHWYTQTVRPGFADETMRQVKVAVDAAIDRAV
jgi:hypothetical protein